MASIRPWALGAAAYIGLAGVCAADTLSAKLSSSRTTVAFVASQAYTNATLTVVGPNGFAVRVANKNGLPSLNLAQLGSVPDGQYTYQLNAATAAMDSSAVAQNNGRAKNANVRARKGADLSGTFVVKGGAIVIPVAALSARSGDQDQD